MSGGVVGAPVSAPVTDFASLCESNLDIVKHAVAAYAARIPGYVDVDDLTGAALLGLVEAARRFNPDLGVPFQAYALTRVRGAIFDAARDADFASRKTRSEARRVDAVVEQLTAKLRRAPSAQEITSEIGMPLDALRDLRARVHQGVVLSLDMTFEDEEDPGLGFGETLVDADMPPLETLERRELDAYVRDCVESLPERLRVLVKALYYEGRQASEVALEMGITESRVSQLRSDALKLLREALGAQYAEIFERTADSSSSSGSKDDAPLSKRGAEVAKAAAARSTYGERLSQSTSVLL